MPFATSELSQPPRMQISHISAANQRCSFAVKNMRGLGCIEEIKWCRTVTFCFIEAVKAQFVRYIDLIDHI